MNKNNLKPTFFFHDPVTNKTDVVDCGMLDSYDIDGHAIRVITDGTTIRRKRISEIVGKVHNDVWKNPAN